MIISMLILMREFVGRKCEKNRDLSGEKIIFFHYNYQGFREERKGSGFEIGVGFLGWRCFSIPL